MLGVGSGNSEKGQPQRVQFPMSSTQLGPWASSEGFLPPMSASEVQMHLDFVCPSPPHLRMVFAPQQCFSRCFWGQFLVQPEGAVPEGHLRFSRFQFVPGPAARPGSRSDR